MIARGNAFRFDIRYLVSVANDAKSWIDFQTKT